MKQKLLLSLATLTAASSLGFASDAIPSRALWGSVCGLSNATANNYKGTLNKMLLSWRMLPGDGSDTAFDLYRTVAEGPEAKLNSEPLFITNFQDHDLSFTEAGDVRYRLTYAGNDETIGEYILSEAQRMSKLPYISIPLTPTHDVCPLEGYEYQANDISVGDLDGDGEMEIVVKRLLAHGDNDGTGGGQSPKVSQRVCP